MSNEIFLSASLLFANANGGWSADGMMLAALFLLPLLVYILLYRLVQPARRSPLAALAAAGFVAAVSCLGVRHIVFNSTPWPNSTQVIWTGMEADDALNVGGAGDDAIVGWPNGTFAPSLTAVKGAQAGTAEVVIANGGGFVFDEDKREVLNGEELALGESKTFGQTPTTTGYTLTFVDKRLFGLITWEQQITVAEGGKTLAIFGVPSATDVHRVFSLGGLVEGREVEEERDEETSKQVFAMKDWAADVRLLVTPQNRIRVLERLEQSGSRRHVVNLPAKLSVYWTNLRLEIRLNGEDGRLVLDFLPPWRTASPIPPQSGDGNTILTVTGRAVPGDYAFLLPLGGAAERLRKSYYIAPDDARGPVFVGAAAGADTANAANLPSNIQRRLNDRDEDTEGRTSEIEVPAASGYMFKIATANNIPGQAATTRLIVLAFAIFVGGLLLAYRRRHSESLWCVYGIAAAFWNILLFRLLLSLRYALPPDNLDRFVVKGLTLALVALALLPGLLLLGARLRWDAYNPPSPAAPRRWTTLLAVTGYIVLLFAACVVEYKYTASLWTALPPRFIYSVGWEMSLLLLGLFLYLLMRAVYLYALPLLDRGSSPGRVYLFLAPLVLIYEVLNFVKKSLLLAADWIWSRMATQKRLRWGAAFLLLAGQLVTLSVVCIILGRAFSSDTLIHDIVVPFIFCWPPAVLWLMAVKYFPPSGQEPQKKFWRILYLAVPTILVPIFLVPPALNDIGSLLGALAVFLPMILILWAARIRPCRGAAVASLLLALGCALLLYVNLDFISSYASRLPGTKTAVARLLIYKEGGVGGKIQRRITYAAIGRRGDSDSASLQEIRNGYQHTQESKHIANQGGLRGRGFGIAPVRNSQVRQDTLQYDSVYSFFVCGEYGLLGGICLLLLYAVPLALVLISGRRRFDIGHAVATMITGAFLIEALFHAGMNTGAFPFTGRNLPLLAVGSLSDLLRWGILFCAAGQAVLWRYKNSEINEESPAFFEQRVTSGTVDTGAEVTGQTTPKPVRKNLFNRLRIWLASLPKRRDAKSPVGQSPRSDHAPTARQFGYERAVLFVALIPAFMMLCVVWTGVAIIRDKELSQPFSWNNLLEYVQDEIIGKDGQGRLRVNQQKYIIEPHNLGALHAEFIEQERQRFNALPLDERKQIAGEKNFLDRLEKVQDLAGYDKLLDDFRREHPLKASRRKPSLFRLVPPPKHADEEGRIPLAEGEYGLEVNPAFNTRISFDSAESEADIPRATFSGNTEGTYTISSDSFNNFTISIPDRAAQGTESRTVKLEARRDGKIELKEPRNPAELRPRVEFYLAFHPVINQQSSQTGARQELLLGTFEATKDGLIFRNNEGGVPFVMTPRNGQPRNVGTGESATLELGSRLRMQVQQGKLAPNLEPEFRIDRSARGALIGAAWVMGRWVTAYDLTDSKYQLPWTRYLANMLENESGILEKEAGGTESPGAAVSSQYGQLTLNRDLQEAAMWSTAEYGRQLHETLLRRETTPVNKLPPQVGLSIVELPTGRVLALGGWPRMTSDYLWKQGSLKDGTPTGWIPPVGWLEEKAPDELRTRYGGDRNFARNIMGSSTKPLWASAVLKVHPELYWDLRVTGPEKENEVFGIQISDSSYVAQKPPRSGWLDFDEYMKVSSNRYQIRLGFLGLAERDGERVAIAGDSPSELESMNGRQAWKKFPKFPDAISFSHEKNHNRMIQNLKNQRLAFLLRDMYSINIGDDYFFKHRLSFWTKNEADDVTPKGGGPDGFTTARRNFFNPISPQTVDFDFNKIESPRQYVSMLLGGETNRWANVDIAAAFGTCITGHPVLPHIIERPGAARARESRVTFPDVAARVRPGLAKVVNESGGTAYGPLEASEARAFIDSMPGVKVYAKTGTLSVQGSDDNWKRLVLAIVKWKDGSEQVVETGLVFSIFVERDAEKKTAFWLGEFLSKNRELIKHLLDEGAASAH
jgi:cell division protein FtsW (lipid II flippase)/cell division protein FtsI/penicillin-binding protein 2